MQAEKYFLRRTCRRRKGWDFLSPRPLRGATKDFYAIPKDDYISIHAPLAGRDTTFAPADKRDLMISIHAPLAGCDHRSAGQGGHGGHFSPRTPCGVRRGVSIVAVVGRAFQSTHPLRGATLCPCAFTCLLLHFNPRAPCGVRRKEFQDYSKRFHDISIHAPLAGRDPITSAD